MEAEMKARLDALLMGEIAAAEAVPTEPPTPRERHQRALTLAVLFRVVILSTTLAKALAAPAADAAKPAAKPAPKAPRRAAPAAAPPAPSPANEMDMDDTPQDPTADTAVDLAADSAGTSPRVEALRSTLERRLEGLTGRRESKSCPEGFEWIGAGAADGQLADDGPCGAAAAGGG